MADLLINAGNDFEIAHADLASDGGLESAVRLSLGTDARALPDDVLPDGSRHRRGWWGDALAAKAGDRIGSRRWLLAREKQQPSVLRALEAYDSEALQWLVDDGVAERVEVEASNPRPGWLVERVRIYRPDEEGPWELIWEQLLWGAEDQKVVEETAPLPLTPMSVSLTKFGRFYDNSTAMKQRVDVFAASTVDSLGGYLDEIGTADTNTSVFVGSAQTGLGDYVEPLVVPTYDVVASSGALGNYLDNIGTADTNTSVFAGSETNGLGGYNDG